MAVMRSNLSIFDALLAAVFSLAAYDDGSVWQSGVGAGIAIALLLSAVNTWATRGLHLLK